MGSLWYIVIIISIAYGSWRLAALQRPEVKEQLESGYQYVRAGMICTALQVVFMFVLHSSKLPIGSVLPFACFATWTGTIIWILIQSSVPKAVGHFAVLVLISTPLIVFVYPRGVPQFLADADQFSVAIIRRITANTAGNGEPTAGINLAPPTASASKASPDANAGDGPVSNPTTFSQLRISHLLRATFFFVNVFLVMHYFGTMWYYAYLERSKQALKTALEQDAANQIVLFLSVGLSLWIAFVLLGFDALSVSVFSGLVLIGLSVALKDLLSNFFSGALLLWLKSVRVGDVISINKTTVGRVVGITLRYLIVEDRNDIKYLIPYSQLANATVENWSKGKNQVRVKLDLSVAYGTPIERVKEIVTSVCLEVPRVMNFPLPVLLIMGLGESAIDLQLRFRIEDPENGINNVKSEVYEQLLKRFEDAHIEIPYPQREIRIRTKPSDEPPSALAA